MQNEKELLEIQNINKNGQTNNKRDETNTTEQGPHLEAVQITAGMI